MKEQYTLENVSVRLVPYAPLLSDTPIESPEDAIRILADSLRGYDREVMGVVHLRTDGCPINMTIASIGCLNESIAHPRELLKAAFLSSAANVLLFHTHPSGKVEPSKEDIIVTNRMQQLCMLAGIPMVDHIILGNGNQYYSFREKQKLPLDAVHYSFNLDDVDLKVAEREAQNYKPKKSIHESLAEKKKAIVDRKPTVKKAKKQELSQ